MRLTDSSDSPMGRESVLFPVTWKEDEWPFATQVQGVMSGWELPPTDLDVPGVGPFVTAPDYIDFTEGSELPGNLVRWRCPDFVNYEISPTSHPNSLLLKPSRANLTGDWTFGDPYLTGATGLSFIARRQSHTMFSYGVDLSFDPQEFGEEAGVSLFLTQWDHINLGIARSNADTSSPDAALQFEFRSVQSSRGNSSSSYETRITPVPESWKDCGPIRLQIQSLNTTHYSFNAHPANNSNAQIVVGHASGGVVSGGSGPFTGALLGIYATCNGMGANGTACPQGRDAYFSKWRYNGLVQQISMTDYVPATVW